MVGGYECWFLPPDMDMGWRRNPVASIAHRIFQRIPIIAGLITGPRRAANLRSLYIIRSRRDRMGTGLNFIFSWVLCSKSILISPQIGNSYIWLHVVIVSKLALELGVGRPHRLHLTLSAIIHIPLLSLRFNLTPDMFAIYSRYCTNTFA